MPWRWRRGHLPLPLRLLLLPFLFSLLFFLVVQSNRLAIIHRRHHSRSSSPLVNPPPLRPFQPESGLPSHDVHQRFCLYAASAGGRRQPGSPVSAHTSKKQRSMALMRELPRSARSRRFSERAADFFTGHQCRDRFFMVWLAPLRGFGRRELFAVESVFHSHPNACLLIASVTIDSGAGALLLKPFVDRGFRVRALAPDFTYLLSATPAAIWFRRLQRGEIDPGDISLGQNLSNLLRHALLYKYGGAYVDTDVIVLRSFTALRNAIGAQAVDAGTQNWTRLNNAVMVFDREHPLLYDFMKEFARSFDGRKWGHNGPYLVSRVATRVAGRAGYNFSVLPPAAFYPVGWIKIEKLFTRPQDRNQSRLASENLDWIQRRSYAVHLWNRKSSGFKVEEGSVISRLMAACCVLCNFSASAAKAA
ncbi:lactosylceramide 4-alpha-galactosyltransferase-like [Zingiber officinale]|nr:lactosylceramide 4-alpha-galactosyltransferase-like [Zingiber officinale]